MQVPAGVPDDFEKHVHLMSDLLALAFQTDVTRVATYMFANEGSNALLDGRGERRAPRAVPSPQ